MQYGYLPNDSARNANPPKMIRIHSKKLKTTKSATLTTILKYKSKLSVNSSEYSTRVKQHPNHGAFYPTNTAQL